MPNLDKEIMRQAIKDGLREWLDDKFMAFGKWTFTGLMAALFAGLIYLALTGAGWHK
jgi:hypothetical protein